MPAASLANYAMREQAMTDHGRQLAELRWLRVPTRDDIPFTIEAAAVAAWSTDSGMIISAGLIDALRRARILLPSISTIERAGIAGRTRKHATHALLSSPDREQLERIDALFVADPVTGATPLAWLKTIPAAAKADRVREILDRLCLVRRIEIPADAR